MKIHTTCIIEVALPCDQTSTPSKLEDSVEERTQADIPVLTEYVIRVLIIESVLSPVVNTRH